MKKICIALTLLSVAWAAGAQVIVQSPDTGQTHAHHSIIWKQLRCPPGSRTLVASVTFSNVDYLRQTDPPQDDRVDFRFPGVTLDPAAGIFYVWDERGAAVPVAEIRRGIIGKQIVLRPGVQIAIHSASGRVSAKLGAGLNTRIQPWAEQD